jgi:hypothetical protein
MNYNESLINHILSEDVPPEDHNKVIDYYHFLSGYYSLSELIFSGEIEFPCRSRLADSDLDYVPPTIDDELFQYSLKGVSAFKIYD